MADNNSKNLEHRTKDQPLSLAVDWKMYEDALADSHLSDAEKQEMIETLWSVVLGFVDLGFGVHPVQQNAKDDFNFGSFVANQLVTNLEAEAQAERDKQKSNSKPLVPS